MKPMISIETRPGEVFVKNNTDHEQKIVVVLDDDAKTQLTFTLSGEEERHVLSVRAPGW